MLVQLDDEILARLDSLAAESKTSRSALVRQGIAAVLEAAELRAADSQLKEAYRRFPQDADIVLSAERLAAETLRPW